MRIAFDAKRVYRNTTGLGNYGRLLVEWLAKGYPAEEFYLFAPDITQLFQDHGLQNLHAVTPTGVYKTFSSLWRSKFVTADLSRLGIDIYHGLSNEIPLGIQHTKVRSVVTIHDLIFEHYPKQYKAFDTAMYRFKFRYAAANAHKVIAISEQTKDDLIQFYNIPADKITVCYQSCSPAFQQQWSDMAITEVKRKYDLPDKYFLYVGAVIERKNLLSICKAMKALKETVNIPLVVIGKGNAYMQQVKNYLNQNDLSERVIFLSEKANAIPTFRNDIDFPGIYQGAAAFIYPSVYEGFGIPVVEALWSRIPVITSNLSCLPETGGDAAYYIDPLSIDEMTNAMQQVIENAELRTGMITKGFIQAQKFTPQAHAASVMAVYKSLM